MQKVIIVAFVVYTLCQMFEREWYHFSVHHGKLIIMMFKLLEYKTEFPEISLHRRYISSLLRIFLPAELFYAFIGTPTIKPIMKIAPHFLMCTCIIHYIPNKWVLTLRNNKFRSECKVYDYKSIFRLFLLFAQQGVYAITFITRSSSMYFVFSENLKLDTDILYGTVVSSKALAVMSQLKFFFIMILFSFSESISVDCEAIIEKILFKHEYSLAKVGVNCIKYLGLVGLCHIYFRASTGYHWISVFDNSQVIIAYFIKYFDQ